MWSMIPLPYKLGGIAAAVAMLLLGAVWLDNSRQQVGFDRAVAQYTLAELKATEAARIKEQELQGKVTEAIKNAKVRETKLKATAIVLNNELSRMLFDLEEAARNLPGLTADAARLRAATVGAILGECAKEIEGLAGKADGHASDSLMLQEAWPR